MRGTFELLKPDEMEATLTVTATVKDWKQLRDQLVDRYPSWQLSSIVADLVHQAELKFFAKQDSPS